VNPLSDTFDYFVDDLLSSNANLLKGELDFLLMQDLFNSTDLKFINKTEIEDNESLAA
jgi:heptaprenylglyceryl phosphate synthase